MASSLNGRIGGHTIEGDMERHTLGLTGPEDQAALAREVEGCEAIIVGASSIKANGRCLERRKANGQFPTWYILTTSVIDPTFEFWRQDIPRVIISPGPILIPSHATGQISNVVYPRDAIVADFVMDLVKKNHRGDVLLFGGGKINKLFYERNWVDELHLTLGPLFIPGENSPFLISPDILDVVKFRLLSSHTDKSFVFLNYDIIKN
jgi:riboflavin biosynthesis pyrimidine reductase